MIISFDIDNTLIPYSDQLPKVNKSIGGRMELRLATDIYDKSNRIQNR